MNLNAPRLYDVSAVLAAFHKVQPPGEFGQAIDVILPPETTYREIYAICDAIRILRDVDPILSPMPNGLRIVVPAEVMQ